MSAKQPVANAALWATAGEMPGEAPTLRERGRELSVTASRGEEVGDIERGKGTGRFHVQLLHHYPRSAREVSHHSNDCKQFVERYKVTSSRTRMRPQSPSRTGAACTHHTPETNNKSFLDTIPQHLSLGHELPPLSH